MSIAAPSLGSKRTRHATPPFASSLRLLLTRLACIHVAGLAPANPDISPGTTSLAKIPIHLGANLEGPSFLFHDLADKSAGALLNSLRLARRAALGDTEPSEQTQARIWASQGHDRWAANYTPYICAHGHAQAFGVIYPRLTDRHLPTR